MNFLACACLLAVSAQAAPISLHPDNPHYFLYEGNPVVLVTSAEHYGAVLNTAFDYTKYLDALAADGLNLTRAFSGTYLEPQGAFNIAKNTLAPQAEHFLAPWARSEVPGNASGGNKFDLRRWNPAYFVRLKDFIAQAGRRGVIVELTFFCPMYEEMQWKLSPMNVANNINGAGTIGRNDVHTLDKNGPLLAIQEALVRKIVSELHEAENLCYEICNEPYFGGVTMAWQHRMVDVIVEAEKDLPHRHLITQNIANGSQKIENPHPAVSVFNFHYASPPTAVALNYGLNKVIGDNETGFKGNADDHYRKEAWEFILAGGGLYNNLDYSFAAGHEDGTFVYPPTQPGGGNTEFRQQMKRLKEFIHSFDFVKMKPGNDLLIGAQPDKMICQALAERGRQYAVYCKGAPGFTFEIELPAGDCHVTWMDVVSGRTETPATRTHGGGRAKFQIPAGFDECAVKIVREEPAAQ